MREGTGAIGTYARLHQGRFAARGVATVLIAILVGGSFFFGAPAGASAFGCDIPGRMTPHAEDWVSIDVPAFPTGEQKIEMFAVNPIDHRQIYVTNGLSVLRSMDGGCNWGQSYALPETGNGGMNAQDARILEIEVSAAGRVYLPVQGSGDPVRPFLLVSDDAGATWDQPGGTLLDGLWGHIIDFDAAVADRDAAYMLLKVDGAKLEGALSVDAGENLLATTDGGQNWNVRESFALQGQSITAPVVTVSGRPYGFRGIAANPLRGDDVWLYGESETFRSTSSGTFPVPLQGIGVLDISLDGRFIVAYDDNDPEGFISTDDGQTFLPTQPMRFVDSADAATATGMNVALSSVPGVFIQSSLGLPDPLKPAVYDISPKDGRAIYDVAVAAAPAGILPYIYGRTDSTLEVRRFPMPDHDYKVTQASTAPLVEGDLKKRPGKLLPARQRVELKLGKSKTIPYTIELPTSPTPLDVYFMIDISGSMQGTIDGVESAMQDIVDELAESGVDAHFGVGAFRSFEDPPAYDRVRDIGPVDAELRRALGGMTAAGGGQESQFAALLQSVTGDGLHTIRPGLNMNFRKDSLRVAILTTDEPISQGGSHPGPTEVIDALVAHDVKQVGLAIQEPPLLGDHNYENPGAPANMMSTVAEGSGAVAPEQGVNCDGDPDIEIPPGRPLVCQLSASRSSEAGFMADVIVNILDALEDLGTVEVVTEFAASSASAEGEVVTAVEPQVFPTIDFKTVRELTFDLTVTCPESLEKDQVFPVDVEVNRGSLGIAAADLTVACDAPKPPKKPEERSDPAPVLPLILPAAIPPPPPRPPDPIPEPNPQPNPQPNPNPQANPQSGFAQQRQQQAQLALAHQQTQAHEVAPESNEELLMSRHKQQAEKSALDLAFYLGIVTMTLTYGFATLAQKQRRAQHQHNGTRRY